MYTRSDYMEGKVSFDDYYLQIAQEAHLSYSNSKSLPMIIAALQRGDEHLSSIPLSWWDAQGIFGKAVLAIVFKAHGDGWTLAGNVCVHKAAAREAARKVLC